MAAVTQGNFTQAEKVLVVYAQPDGDKLKVAIFYKVGASMHPHLVEVRCPLDNPRDFADLQSILGRHFSEALYEKVRGEQLRLAGID